MSDLDTLFAEREITAQLVNYCRAMDRCDHELGYGVFHPDAVLDYGAMFQGSPRDFVDATLRGHLELETHLHRISNITIKVRGDRAGSETYVDAIFRGAASGGAYQIRTCGRYIDSWEKRAGRWAISKRTYLHAMDSSGPAADKQRFEGAGSRDGSDPSYAALKP